MNLRRHAGVVQGAALLVLLHFVAALVLTVCPALHERLHHHHDHEAADACLVDGLSQGSCDVTAAAVFLPVPGVVEVGVVAMPMVQVPRRFLGSRHERGPPAWG